VIPKISIVTENFKQVKVTQPHVALGPDTVVSPSIKLKPFEKVENKAVGLPEGITVNIPDVSEELEQLLQSKRMISKEL